MHSFLHANASIRHRRNTISLLKDDTGQELQNHEDKANLLWRAFKERLGTYEFTHMNIDLPALLEANLELD